MSQVFTFACIGDQALLFTDSMEPRRGKRTQKPRLLCVFSETYLTGKVVGDWKIVGRGGSPSRRGRGRVQAMQRPARRSGPIQHRTSSGTMSDPASRRSVIFAITPEKIRRRRSLELQTPNSKLQTIEARPARL